ncbi:hypothetical protein FDECE_7849 [Fusarium decemcellulare]|nr:hypothetical protein FDECE_7849 [Fusarium decemcellulare]
MTSSSPVWLITGAGTGFGNAITLSALRRGHRVVATARRLLALSDLAKAGAHALVLDVTALEDDIASKVKEAHGVYGRLDYLVNAAGYVLESACEEASEKEVFDQFNTNVFGTIKLCRAVIPYFRAQSHGVIANFGSLASWNGSPATSFYNSSKWAVSGFTEALAAEVKGFGIDVTCIEPGMFRTAFLNTGKRTSSAIKMKDVYGNTGAAEYRAALDGANNAQRGDVVKGAEVVVDVVTKTGVAKGKEFPVRVALGPDTLSVVRSKCESTLALMKEWEAVAASTDHDDFKD